jgi:hypothetical protein
MTRLWVAGCPLRVAVLPGDATAPADQAGTEPPPANLLVDVRRSPLGAWWEGDLQVADSDAEVVEYLCRRIRQLLAGGALPMLRPSVRTDEPGSP